MAAKAEVSDVDRRERPNAGRECLSRKRHAERPGKHLREKCEHRCAPGSASVTLGNMGHGFGVRQREGCLNPSRRHTRKRKQAFVDGSPAWTLSHRGREWICENP